MQVCIRSECKDMVLEYINYCEGNVQEQMFMIFLVVHLQPYDEQYLRSCDPPIKFLSFHSYIRKLKGGNNKS